MNYRFYLIYLLFILHLRTVQIERISEGRRMIGPFVDSLAPRECRDQAPEHPRINASLALQFIRIKYLGESMRLSKVVLSDNTITNI